MTSRDRPGQVTTFYSFKGGVGRTFLLANVAWLLARWGRRVLCLDWDLEAPGLHHYLAPIAPKAPGVLDLIQALGAGEQPGWEGWVQPVEGPWTGGGCLHLLGAGREDEAYLRGLQGLDWGSLARSGFAPRLEELRAAWVEGYDHVLVDSRTGISDVGNLCAAQLPDVLVLVFTATAQSLHGADRVADLAEAARDALPLDRGRFRVLPVPSRMHTGEEQALEEEWSARFADDMGPRMQPWLHEDIQPAEALAHLRVREQARWSYGEQVPVQYEDLRDPQRISWAMANAAALIDQRLSGSEGVIRRRHESLTALAGEAGLQPPDRGPERRVYISYPGSMRAEAEKLVEALDRAGVPVWFDLREIAPGYNIYAKVHAALEHTQVFVLMLDGEKPGADQAEEVRIFVETQPRRRDRLPIAAYRDLSAMMNAPDVPGGFFKVNLESGLSNGQPASAFIARVWATLAPVPWVRPGSE